MTRPNLLVLAMVFVWITTTPSLSAQPPRADGAAEKDILKPEANDDELRKLLKERYNVATREYAIYMSRLDIDPLAHFQEQLFACCRRRAEVAQEIFAKPDDQIQILKKLLDEAKNLEMVFVKRNQGAGIGAVMPQDVERARGARLDVEIMLVKAKQKAKPAK